MDLPIIADQVFAALGSDTEPLQLAEYEACVFRNCNFANTDWTGMSFTDCVFENCDLSMISSQQVIIRDVQFGNCKLLGWHFEDCNPFLLAFSCDNCTLDFSSFFRVKLKGATFLNCKMHEVDFTEAILEASDFSGSDLANATFESTNLRLANLSTAHHFRLDPEINQVKGAKFSSSGLSGLLGKYGIKIV